MQAFHTSFGVAIESRLHFLLIRDELVSALCWSQRDASLSDPLPALSRARTVDTIKDTLRHAGQESYGYWSDGCGDEFIRRLEDWAGGLVDLHFGDLLALKENPND